MREGGIVNVDVGSDWEEVDGGGGRQWNRRSKVEKRMRIPGAP